MRASHAAHGILPQNPLARLRPEIRTETGNRTFMAGIRRRRFELPELRTAACHDETAQDHLAGPAHDLDPNHAGDRHQMAPRGQGMVARMPRVYFL